MRKVIYATQDEQLVELTLTELVIARIIVENENGDEFTLEELTARSPDMVKQCLDQGWFTRTEWVEQWLHEENRNLDEELQEIWPGGEMPEPIEHLPEDWNSDRPTFDG